MDQNNSETAHLAENGVPAGGLSIICGIASDIIAEWHATQQSRDETPCVCDTPLSNGSTKRGGVAEDFFNPQQLVVLTDAVRPTGRTGLDLTGAQCHCQVGDRGIFGFT